jgi:antirestriction protein ArdC
MKNEKSITETKNRKSADVYSIVNDRIIEHLKNGVIPWRQPWTDAGLPKNLITGNSYKGINVMLLSSLGHKQNSFLTFKQVKELGGKVNKGEKGELIVFWKWHEKENKETGKKEEVPTLRYYRVFNISHCAGIPEKLLPPITERKHDPIKSCEEIIQNMPDPPEILHKEQRAYYNPLHDYINMPKPETFGDGPSYYSSLFHELIHSTGNTNRLNRAELMRSGGFGSESYAKEELTAEIGACYLKSYAGLQIERLENHASYIQNWLDRLKRDRRFILQASGKAEKAVEWVLGKEGFERVSMAKVIAREEELMGVRGDEDIEMRR